VAAQNAADTTRRNLYDIGSFRRVEVSFEPIASEEPGDTRLVNLAIEAEEPRRFQLRYGVLFATDTGERGGAVSSGLGVSVELRDRNFLGRAIQASAGGHYEKNLQALTALFSFPRAFDRAIRTKIYGRDRRERLFGDEVTLLKTERDVSIEQRWRPIPSVELAWGYQHGYRLYRLNQDEQLFDFGGYLAGPIASLVIDRRDSPFDATRGWFHSSSLKVGVESLGSDLGYVRYLTRQSVYQQLGPLTLAASARWGTMIGYSGTAPLSTLDLFFLAGGTNTVRGYRENSLSAVNVADIYLGGTSLLVLNGELRFPIFRMVRGAAFVDSGNTFTATREIAIDRMAVGSGLGLRIATPLAPLRLDFGYPVTERFGPPRLRVHFSIGQMF
jgi:outer membrane protein assembly factor BamA